MTAELSVGGLDAAYGASQVLFDVHFEVDRGETLALMGRIGAGKSTTFKAIAGLLPPGFTATAVTGRSVEDLKAAVADADYAVWWDVPVTAEILAAEGIDVEVIDLRWLNPLDEDTIFESVRKAPVR